MAAAGVLPTSAPFAQNPCCTSVSLLLFLKIKSFTSEMPAASLRKLGYHVKLAVERKSDIAGNGHVFKQAGDLLLSLPATAADRCY